MISKLGQFPQSFSHDMYVRLKAGDIADLELTHLYSERLGHAYTAPTTGVTEWIGEHETDIMSIAWDWIVLSDGLVCMPSNAVIRTNIMLVDAQGYDMGPYATENACAVKVASWSWQDALQKWLHRGGSRSSGYRPLC